MPEEQLLDPTDPPRGAASRDRMDDPAAVVRPHPIHRLGS